MREIISTLNELQRPNERAVGSTTRQIDWAIQHLFKGYRVKCEDHYQYGKDYKANERLFKLIVRRLNIEHQGIMSEVRANINDFTLGLKD